MASRQHPPFVHGDQFGGHGAHKRADAQGRMDDLAPEVSLGTTRGRGLEPARLRRVCRLRHVTRTVRRQGQIRPYNVGIDVDRELWGHPVKALIYDDRPRVERAEHVLVTSPGSYDTRPRRITEGEASGRHQYHRVRVIQLVLFALGVARTGWRMPCYRRAQGPRQAVQARQMSLPSRVTN